MPYRFLFVMDPLSSVLVDKDTTFVFMLEALGRGHEIYFAELHDVFARAHQGYALARRCEVARATPHYRFLDEGSEYAFEHFHAIFMRKDPPADAASHGIPRFEFEARRAAAEIEGRRSLAAGAALSEALRRDAKARGFGLYAR